MAANENLRIKMGNAAKLNSFSVHFPEPFLCTDNAAMIALAGLKKYQKYPEIGNDYFDLDAKVNFPLVEY